MEQLRSEFHLDEPLHVQLWLFLSGAVQGDLGYDLAPRYWGRGYATEAARAIVRFGFEELGLHRIWSWCIADNVASARVMEKVGMRLEGRQRDKERFKGRWWDRLLYAILEDEWRAGQARALTTCPGGYDDLAQGRTI